MNKIIRIDADDCWTHYITNSGGIKVEIPEEKLKEFDGIYEKYNEMEEYLSDLYDKAWKKKTLKEQKGKLVNHSV